MVKISEIIEKMENLAPLEYASSWDNAGWQIYLGDYEVKKAMLALSPTLDVVNQAIENNCKLIIAHHPMIFEKLNKLDVNNNLAVIKAIQNNIQVYSAHTNLDIVKNGVADRLAGMLHLINTCPIEGTDIGFGRIGELKEEESLDSFILKLKNLLDVDKIKLINPSNITKIKKIALTPGSGGDFINKLKDIDLYITGDVKYHTALEVTDMAVIDAGHMETERIILPVLKSLLSDLNIKITLAKENSPWQIV